MYNLGQKLLAEFIGTFAWLFVGVGSICAAQQAGAPQGVALLATALAPGLAVATMMAAVGPISGGHFNPAVTAGFWVTRRMGTFQAIGYVLAQLAGAAAGAYAISKFYLEDVWRRAMLGTPVLSADVSPVLGMGIEALLTFLLVFVFFAVAAEKDSAAGLRAPCAVGLAVTGDILAGGVLTGAALNPARAFGPALVGHYWLNQSVFWIGPIGGAIAAGSLYTALLARKPAE